MIKKIGALFHKTTGPAAEAPATTEDLLAKDERDLAWKIQSTQIRLTDPARFNTFITTDKVYLLEFIFNYEIRLYSPLANL